MEQFNLYDAKSNLSDIVERASQGATFLIAKAGIPKAMLCPINTNKRKPIKYGAMLGEIKISKDFDAPLPPELIVLFEGNSH